MIRGGVHCSLTRSTVDRDINTERKSSYGVNDIRFFYDFARAKMILAFTGTGNACSALTRLQRGPRLESGLPVHPLTVKSEIIFRWAC